MEKTSQTTIFDSSNNFFENVSNVLHQQHARKSDEENPQARESNEPMENDAGAEGLMERDQNKNQASKERDIFDPVNLERQELKTYPEPARDINHSGTEIESTPGRQGQDLDVKLSSEIQEQDTTKTQALNTRRSSTLDGPEGSLGPEKASLTTTAIDTTNRSSTASRDVDGGWAWLVAIGGFILHLLMAATNKAFGLLLPSLSSKFSAPTSTVSTVIVLAVSLIFCAGPLVSLMLLKFSMRQVALLGSGLTFVGVFLSSFCDALWQLFIFFGVFVGLGISLCHTTSFVAIGRYFDRRRSVAVGISTSGIGVGGVALPPLFVLLLQEFGLRGVFWILSALMAHLAVAGALLRTPSDGRDGTRREELGAVDGKVEKRRADKWNFIFTGRFLAYSLSHLLTAGLTLSAWVYLPSFALECNLSLAEAASLISVNSICDLTGRLLSGPIFDSAIVKKRRVKMAPVVTLLNAGCDFFISFAGYNYATFFCYCAVFGFFNGTYTNLRATVLQDLFGRNDLSLVFGLFHVGIGIGAFALPLAMSATAERLASFAPAFMIQGFGNCLASLLLFVVVVLHQQTVSFY